MKQHKHATDLENMMADYNQRQRRQRNHTQQREKPMLTDTEKARYEQLLSEPNPTPEELEELEYFVGKMSSEIHQSICHITGSSEATFSKKVPESELLDTCKDIWDHPSKYSDYADGSEGAYYKFLKVLWVEYPDGHEERLADIANDRVYPAL